MSTVYTGKVIWFKNKKGMGFIAWEKDGVAQTDMFVHFSDIQMNGYKTLSKDDVVEFEIGQNIKGQPKAINVKVVK